MFQYQIAMNPTVTNAVNALGEVLLKFRQPSAALRLSAGQRKAITPTSDKVNPNGLNAHACSKSPAEKAPSARVVPQNGHG